MNIVKSKFEGIDVSNEISLLEYGLIVYKEKHEDNSGSQFCVYKISEDSFGCGHIYENDINSLLCGNDWISKDELKEFMDCSDIQNMDEYLVNPLYQKISDLISYYGTENIFGTGYSPMDEKEVIERYL